MEETAFKQLMAQQTGQDASVFENMTIEQIGEMMHVELKSFRQEKEDEDGNKAEVTCVDVRPIFASMLESGQMEKDDVLSMRDGMEKTLDTMGSSLVKSMGIAYAVSADKAAGLDIDRIQKSYLLTAGLKMVGMALLMGVVTVFVGLFASRVAAGIGRDLRDQVFKKVVGFSNAEMDQFSTASLITRSTNDIQPMPAPVFTTLMTPPIPRIGAYAIMRSSSTDTIWICWISFVLLVIREAVENRFISASENDMTFSYIFPRSSLPIPAPTLAEKKPAKIAEAAIKNAIIPGHKNFFDWQIS